MTRLLERRYIQDDQEKSKGKASKTAALISKSEHDESLSSCMSYRHVFLVAEWRRVGLTGDVVDEHVKVEAMSYGVSCMVGYDVVVTLSHP